MRTQRFLLKGIKFNVLPIKSTYLVVFFVVCPRLGKGLLVVFHGARTKKAVKHHEQALTR